MWYQVALFIHLTGALILFICLGLECLGLNRLRRAERVEQVREVSAMLRVLGVLFPVTTVLILSGGLYMAITAWSFSLAWLDAALVAVIVMTVLGDRISGRRMAVIGRTAFTTPDGPLPPSLRARTTDPVLIFWGQLGVFLGWWIVFLMTLKPALPGTLVSLGVAMLLAVGFTQLILRALRNHPENRGKVLTNQEISHSASR